VFLIPHSMAAEGAEAREIRDAMADGIQRSLQAFCFCKKDREFFFNRDGLGSVHVGEFAGQIGFGGIKITRLFLLQRRRWIAFGGG
jgi:hypothetical protein